ncbi:MAG: ferritin-like domain-containing protein, partial [Myxococcota bacterium]
AELAAETFAEGVVGETIATLVAERSLAQCGVVPIRKALEAIITDEAQHAALAWATVSWAIEEGGAEVANAVRQTAAELRNAMAEPQPAFPTELAQALRFHGRLEPQAMRRATLDGWNGIIDPMLAELIG